MGRGRKRRGRSISGLLLLDKPSGVTSNAALQEVKRLFYAAKAGHTGSLDPLATGVLPLCFGEATKFSKYLLNAEKTYRAVIVLGATSDTDDADGSVVWQSKTDQLHDKTIVRALDGLTGEQMQVPPMYSALKVNGQRLYELARQGIEIEREAREVNVHQLELQRIVRSNFGNLQLSKACEQAQTVSASFAEERAIEIEVTLVVSKGTYIRSLAAELGARLGVGGYLGGLVRTKVGSLALQDTVSLEALRGMKEADELEQMDHLLTPTVSFLSHMPHLMLDEHTGYYLKQGNPVQVPNSPLEGEVCLTMEDGEFIGVGMIDDSGRVAPKRLVSQSSQYE